MGLRFGNGRLVEVIADEPALRESLGHQQRRKPDAAADIGDLGPRP